MNTKNATGFCSTKISEGLPLTTLSHWYPHPAHALKTTWQSKLLDKTILIRKCHVKKRHLSIGFSDAVAKTSLQKLP